MRFHSDPEAEHAVVNLHLVPKAAVPLREGLVGVVGSRRFEELVRARRFVVESEVAG